MNFDKIKILFLIILAAFIRFIIFFNSDNFAGAVPMGRVVSAFRIVGNPSLKLNFCGNVSLLYHYLLAAVLRFWPDPLISPRILSLVFGIFIIIPFYFLVKILFSERVAFYSSILLSLYPLHAIQSTLSTSDVIFHFFFFCSLYYLFRFKLKEKNVCWLILSAILFNIAAMLRFESWTFIPLLSIFLYRDGKRYSITFFLLSLILPFIWLYLCYHHTGNAFYSFTASAKTSHAEILLQRVPYSRELFGWLKILYKMLGYIVVICAVSGILYSFVKKRYLYLASLFLYLFSLYTLNTIAGRMWYNERYSIILGLLILPYAVLCIEKIPSFLKFNPAILLLPFIFFSALQFQKITIHMLPTLPKEVKEVANWLKLNVSLSEKLILSSDAWDASDQDIVIRSSLCPANFFVVSTPLANPKSVTKEIINEYITNQKPSYLILNSGSFLQKILNFDMTREDLDNFGYKFKLVYSQDTPDLGRFNIYKIYHNDGQ